MVSAPANQNTCTYKKLSNINKNIVENFLIISVCTLVIFEVCVSESISRVKKWLLSAKCLKLLK